MNSGKAQLFDALVSGQGLQELVETAARVLGQPMALCDPCWIVRMKSEAPAVPEKFMQSIPRGQCLSVSFLEAYELAHSMDSRWIRLEVAEYQCLVRPICSSDGFPQAYLIIWSQNSRLTREQQALIEIFSQIIQCGLPSAGQNLILLPLRETILMNLICGQEPVEFSGVQDNSDKSGHEYFVCVIDNAPEQVLKATKMLEIVQKIEYHALIVYEGYPVLLIECGDSSMSSFQSVRDQLNSQLTKLRLQGGISYPFAHLEDFNLYYRQAKRANSCRTKDLADTTLIAYLDIACYDLATACGNNRCMASQDLHPVIEAILQYDSQQGTSYFKTLAAFVESGGNLKACAQKLGVRWSTLNNRIGRICDLFSLDLKDPLILCQIYFSSSFAKLCSN